MRTYCIKNAPKNLTACNLNLRDILFLYVAVAAAA